MDKLPTYNLDPTASNPAEIELKPMILVPLLDTAFETSLLGCRCGSVNGLGTGGACACGSENGGGG